MRPGENGKKTFESVVALEEYATLSDAVSRARQIAQKGDSVLLSPMCASFDMFANYEERGRCFKGARPRPARPCVRSVYP